VSFGYWPILCSYILMIVIIQCLGECEDIAIIEEAEHQAKELKKEAEGAGEKIAGEVREQIAQVKKILGTEKRRTK
jgi:hypothetical protein